MSEDEDRKVGQTDEDTRSDDVEAHVKATKARNDEGAADGDDDVEAHVKSNKL